MTVEFTNAAIDHIRHLLEYNKINYIRFGIKGSGCKGMTYVVEYYNGAPRNKDIELIIDDAKIIIDNKSYKLLEETIIDYRKSLMETGFIFSNKLEKSKCGCGKSFSI